MYIYKDDGNEAGRAKFLVLAWQLGTPEHIPAVNGDSPPAAFRRMFGKLSPRMGAARGNAAVKRLGE